MPRFAAIEGLRAWLAWAVVVSHISQITGLSMHGGHGAWLDRFGHTGVMVFIVISGFVITGLVVDRKEPWPRYIIRRAFRIFPAYWVAILAALATLPLAIAVMGVTPWQADPAYTFDEILVGWRDTIGAHPIAQAVLHAVLIQGVVPDSIWPSTSNAVLGPAWSLTLEWQFYLVAPALVWLLAGRRWRIRTVLAIAVLGFATMHGVFGTYWLPTFFPGAAYIFLIGIACRLGFERMKATVVGPEVALAALGVGFILQDFLWLGVWAAIYLFLLHGDAWKEQANGRPVAAGISALVASRPAQYFGARSYSVYLIHLPILELAAWAVLTQRAMSQTELFWALAVTVIPATLLVSELLYRFVERPMIALGARLASSPAKPLKPAASEVGAS
jgi:peptidoglycan/LPS O-acetylase OafA/YrhL